MLPAQLRQTSAPMSRTSLPREQPKHMPSDLMQSLALLEMRLYIRDHLFSDIISAWRGIALKHITIHACKYVIGVLVGRPPNHRPI